MVLSQEDVGARPHSISCRFKVCIPDHLWEIYICMRKFNCLKAQHKVKTTISPKIGQYTEFPRPRLLTLGSRSTKAGCRRTQEAYSNTILGPIDRNSGLVGFLWGLRNMHILQKCHKWFSSQPSLRNTKLTAFYIVIYSQFHKYTISDTSWKFLITND